MSVYGCVFIILSVTSGALSVYGGLPDLWDMVAQGSAALFGTLSAVSLLIGRRIKFDPILR